MMPVQPMIKVRVPRRNIPFLLVLLFMGLFGLVALEGETKTDEIVVSTILVVSLVFVAVVLWYCLIWKMDVYGDCFVIRNIFCVQRTIPFSQVGYVVKKGNSGTIRFIGKNGRRLFSVYKYYKGAKQLDDIVNAGWWPLSEREYSDGLAAESDITVRPMGLFLGLALFFLAGGIGAGVLIAMQGPFFGDYFQNPVINLIVSIASILLVFVIGVYLLLYYAFVRLQVSEDIYVHRNILGKKQQYRLRQFSHVAAPKIQKEGLDFFVDGKKVFSVSQADKGYDMLLAGLVDEARKGNVKLL